MNKVKIIADGACELAVELIKKYDIDILRIPINDGNTEYVEHENLTSDELFKNMVKGTVYRTSQISSYELKEMLERYINEGRPVVFMSLSSGITGGYDSACMVKDELLEQYENAEVYICDTFCATAGLAMAVLRLAMMAEDCMSFQEIVEAAKFYKMHQEHIWTITNFEYLLRGGRISKGKAVVGGMLNIRPIMEMSKDKGTLEPIDKVRGDKTLMKKLCDNAIARSNGEFQTNQTVVIGYAANYELRDALYNEVINRLKVPKENVVFLQMGCVIGSYIGPDYTGLYFLNQLRGDKYDICL